MVACGVSYCVLAGAANAKQIKGVNDCGSKRVSWAPLPMVQDENCGEAAEAEVNYSAPDTCQLKCTLYVKGCLCDKESCCSAQLVAFLPKPNYF